MASAKCMELNQFRPPTSSDDLCLDFCLILILRCRSYESELATFQMPFFTTCLFTFILFFSKICVPCFSKEKCCSSANCKCLSLLSSVNPVQDIPEPLPSCTPGPPCLTPLTQRKRAYGWNRIALLSGNWQNFFTQCTMYLIA